MISAAKNFAKYIALRLGYRVVPKERDAMTLMSYVESLHVTTVIDVGANNGSTCSHWLAAFGDAHVHAVEAQTRYSGALASVAAAFPGRMSVWGVAATDKSGELLFRVHEDHPSSSSLLSSTANSHELMPFTRNELIVAVEAVRLDELFEKNSVDLGTKILIKLDVQGAELDALRGCEAFLRDVVCVLCEVNLTTLYEGQATLVDLIGFMGEFELELAGITEQFHAQSGRAIYMDAVFLRKSAGTN